MHQMKTKRRFNGNKVIASIFLNYLLLINKLSIDIFVYQFYINYVCFDL